MWYMPYNKNTFTFVYGLGPVGPVPILVYPQMQWSQVGAHNLLQARTAVLNGELRDHFEEWCPELRAEPQNVAYEEPVKLAA
jgi:hypothetical protein